MRQLTEGKKNYTIPVSNGVFGHYGRIKDAIWLFLWYIDKVTREDDTPDGKVGIVLGGCPIHDLDAGSALGVSERTARRWRCRLSSGSYIRQVRTPIGYRVEVLKSKKWSTKPTASDRPKMDGQSSDRPNLAGQPSQSELPDVAGLTGQDRHIALPIVAGPIKTVTETFTETEQKNLPASPPEKRRAQPRCTNPHLFRECFDFAYESFRASKNQPPTWGGKAGGKHRGPLIDLINGRPDLPPGEFRRRFRNFIESTDTFILKQGGSLGYFCANFDKFIDGPLLAWGKPPENDSRGGLTQAELIRLEENGTPAQSRN